MQSVVQESVLGETGEMVQMNNFASKTAIMYLDTASCSYANRDQSPLLVVEI